MGTYLPEGTHTAGMLAAYSRVRPCVEGNTTFYAVPDARTVQRWSDATPPDFRFVFKLPRRITHELRLRNCGNELHEFLSRLDPLGDRLGPTFAQLPPSFGPSDLGTLAQFLAALPRDRPWGVEVRHRDFFVGGAFEQDLDALLREQGVNRVIMDARCVHAGPSDTPAELEEIRTKPNLPVRPISTSTSPVVRFIGQTQPEANPAYWQPWVETCARWITQGLDPYVFIHTPDNVESPGLARAFHDAVSALLLRTP